MTAPLEIAQSTCRAWNFSSPQEYIQKLIIWNHLVAIKIKWSGAIFSFVLVGVIQFDNVPVASCIQPLSLARRTNMNHFLSYYYTKEDATAYTPRGS